MFDIIKQLFTFLFKNPFFVWIFTWNIHIILVSSIVCYYIFSGLKDIGLIDKVEYQMQQVLNNTLDVAAACPQKLATGNWNIIFSCLQNPPARDRTNKYEQETMEVSDGLIARIKQLFGATPKAQPTDQESPANPYENLKK